MVKEKKTKYENDDYSRMAGKDFKEEPFEIGSEKSHPPVPEMTENLKSRGKSKGPQDAMIRDLGVGED